MLLKLSLKLFFQELQNSLFALRTKHYNYTVHASMPADRAVSKDKPSGF